MAITSMLTPRRESLFAWVNRMVQAAEAVGVFRTHANKIRQSSDFKADALRQLVASAIATANTMEEVYTIGVECITKEGSGIGFNEAFIDTLKLFAETIRDFSEAACFFAPISGATTTSLLTQANRISEWQLNLLRIFPREDSEAIAKSWTQYKSGELMDFEAFKHAVLGTEE